MRKIGWNEKDPRLQRPIFREKERTRRDQSEEDFREMFDEELAEVAELTAGFVDWE